MCALMYATGLGNEHVVKCAKVRGLMSAQVAPISMR